MKVYHGSCEEVSLPDILHSRKRLDFGVGFYVTPLEEQAYEKPNFQICLRTNSVIERYLHFEMSYKI